MALDIDKTKIGRRSSRFGSRSKSAFKGRHSSRGVLPLNQGSSPHSGGKSVMSLGGRGGGFGSGRPAGGGVAAALGGLAPAAAPGIGATPPIVGPPPVAVDTPNIPPMQPPRSTPFFPGLPRSPISERLTPLAPPGLFPKPLEPEIDPDLVWRLGQMLAF